MTELITSKEHAYQILAAKGITPPEEVVYAHSLSGMPIQEFMATQCFLEKNTPMPTWAHVDALFDIMFYSEKYGYPHFSTILYSTIKKSIKTAISGIVARWVAETYDGEQELIYLASDAEQSKGRGYKAFRNTLEKHPRYNAEKRILVGPTGRTLWKVNDNEAKYLPDGSIVKAVSSDFAGEAGGNPSATFYTELWAWRLRKEEKLFSEMTVPPTRPKGFRFADTYAGYSGESSVLWTIWRRLKEDGIRITADEPFGIAWNNAIRLTAIKYGFPIPDIEDPPVYIHLPSRTIGYIDQGVKARRFPWQLGEVGEAYYIAERAAALSEAEYLRLHENEWAEPVQALMPIQWYDNCADKTIPELKPRTNVVASFDASVTHDATAGSIHSRHHEHHHEVSLRESRIWYPKDFAGGEMNYDQSILPQLVTWKVDMGLNIVQIVYDKYQLKYLMDRVMTGTCGDIVMPGGRIAKLPALPVRAFNQSNERLESDSMYVTMVRDRKYHHRGEDSELRKHHLNAGSRHDTHENTKLRIVKRDDDSQIDGVVSAAMGVKEVMELGI